MPGPVVQAISLFQPGVVEYRAVDVDPVEGDVACAIRLDGSFVVARAFQLKCRVIYTGSAGVPENNAARFSFAGCNGMKASKKFAVFIMRALKGYPCFWLFRVDKYKKKLTLRGFRTLVG
jgi:hypothetical protein